MTRQSYTACQNRNIFVHRRTRWHLHLTILLKLKTRWFFYCSMITDLITTPSFGCRDMRPSSCLARTRQQKHYNQQELNINLKEEKRKERKEKDTFNFCRFLKVDYRFFCGKDNTWYPTFCLSVRISEVCQWEYSFHVRLCIGFF